MPSPLRTRGEQNALLLTIERHAREFARRAVKRDVDDVIGDVVLYCLERLRSKTWERPENLPGYISHLVKARVVDGLRAEAVEEENVSAAALISRSTGSAGLPPDCEWDEDRINAFRERVMKKLTPRVREAYQLVRIQEASHEDAAAQMDVTLTAINQYIWRAHRVFVEELRSVGIEISSIGVRERMGQRRRRTEDNSSPTIDSCESAIGSSKSSTGTTQSAIGSSKWAIDRSTLPIDPPRRTIDRSILPIHSSKPSMRSSKRPDVKCIQTIA